MSSELDKARAMVAEGNDRKALKSLWVVESAARGNVEEARGLLEVASVIQARSNRGAQRDASYLADLARGYVERLEAGPLPDDPSVPKVADAGKAVEAIYRDCSVSRLYSAAIRTVTEMGYSIINSDSSTGTLSFRTGMSMKSWQGQEMTATVVLDAPTAAKIVIGGRRATQGRQLQVFDWGEARSIAHKFLDKLTPVVAVTPEATQSAPRAPSTAEDLERIARLHEQGLLTADEFAEAKRKLLT